MSSLFIIRRHADKSGGEQKVKTTVRVSYWVHWSEGNC